VIDPKLHPPDSVIALVFDPHFGRKDVKKRVLEYFFMPFEAKAMTAASSDGTALTQR
jgi:hypothetical protein